MLVSIGNLIDDINRQSSWNNLLINTVEILFETTLGVKKGDVIDMDFILPEKVVYDGVCMDKYGNIKVRCYHFKKDGKPRKNPSFERWSCFYCSYKPNKQNSVSDDLDKEIERFWTTKFPQGYKENTPLTLTHGEHKSIDKVEPKSDIEKGKWYVCNTHRYTDFVVGKAYFCPKNGMLKPNENGMARYVPSHCFHLWTIQDAKDGDVLDFDCGVGIFKNLSTDRYNAHCYCYYDRNGKLETNDYSLYDIYKAEPATKEQCDILFQKMHEAGYEWDAENKQLNGIEQKPSWSEEDEEMRLDTIKAFQLAYPYATEEENPRKRNIDWLKSLKERMKGE